jgi:hypothetical protein
LYGSILGLLERAQIRLPRLDYVPTKGIVCPAKLPATAMTARAAAAGEAEAYATNAVSVREGVVGMCEGVKDIVGRERKRERCREREGDLG